MAAIAFRHCYAAFSSVNKHSTGPVFKHKQPPPTSAFPPTASSRQSISTARGLRHLGVCPVRRHGRVRNQRPWGAGSGCGAEEGAGGGWWRAWVEEMNLCAWQWWGGIGGRVWVINFMRGGRTKFVGLRCVCGRGGFDGCRRGFARRSVGATGRDDVCVTRQGGHLRVVSVRGDLLRACFAPRAARAR